MLLLWLSFKRVMTCPSLYRCINLNLDLVTGDSSIRSIQTYRRLMLQTTNNLDTKEDTIWMILTSHVKTRSPTIIQVWYVRMTKAWHMILLEHSSLNCKCSIYFPFFYSYINRGRDISSLICIYQKGLV